MTNKMQGIQNSSTGPRNGIISPFTSEDQRLRALADAAPLIKVIAYLREKITSLEKEITKTLKEDQQSNVQIQQAILLELRDLEQRVSLLKLQKGDKGDKGDQGKDYILTETDRQAIAQSIEVPIVEKVIEIQKTTQIIKEQPIVTEITKEVAIAETAEVLRDKLESLTEDERLDKSAIKGLEEFQKKTTEQVKGIGGQSGLRVYVNETKKGLLKAIDLKSGSGVTVTHSLVNGLDTVTFSAGFLSPQTPTGTVDTSNKTFIFTTAPSLISVDQGRFMQKTSSDGTVNWTGTTTIVLEVAPNFDIFGL